MVLIPPHLMNNTNLLEHLIFFCTINVPLLGKNETNNESFKGVHMLEEEDSTIVVNDVAIFCCKGIKPDCRCVQMHFKQLKF